MSWDQHNGKHADCARISKPNQDDDGSAREPRLIASFKSSRGCQALTSLSDPSTWSRCARLHCSHSSTLGYLQISLLGIRVAVHDETASRAPIFPPGETQRLDSHEQVQSRPARRRNRCQFVPEVARTP